MESSARFRIGLETAQLTGQFFVLFNTILIIVRIHKFLPCIVRRININHFDLARVGFAKKLENLEIIPFNV